MSIALCLLWLLSAPLHAAPADGAVALSASYAVSANEVYAVADGMELKLDVYRPRGSSQPRPTVVYFHGGGWVGGSKERSQLAVLPYMEKGWAAVNVQYRLGRVALAPAAVEDTRCALRWVLRNAEEYGFDPQRIVLTGRSAGGHLALITAMAPVAAGLDDRCPGAKGGRGTDRASVATPEINVAAVVNWSGITDVQDLVTGPNATSYAVTWLGGQPNLMAIAERVSPLAWVRPGLPPILTLHGDQDLVVPFAHATRLHAALDEAGVSNELYVLKDREHFVDYTVDDSLAAHSVIDRFLTKHVAPDAD